MNFGYDFEIFDSIAQAVLPLGRGSVVAFSHVYFDESGTHAGAKVMALAGYWFSADQAAKFSRDWAKDLKSFGISAAHMTDCANKQGEYENLPLEIRIKTEVKLIEHIKRRSKFGIAMALDPSAYATTVGSMEYAPNAYTYLMMTIVQEMSKKMESSGYIGKVAYFFEAGHQHANFANTVMTSIQKYAPGFIGGKSYTSHSFVQKAHALPLQAADMLAWQLSHYGERYLKGYKNPRKDFVALIRPKIDILCRLTDDFLSLQHRLVMASNKEEEGDTSESFLQEKKRLESDLFRFQHVEEINELLEQSLKNLQRALGLQGFK